MFQSSSVIGFLAIFIMIATLITIIVAIIFGIKGFQTKQYGSFKKSLKIFSILCGALLLTSIAFGVVKQYIKQTGQENGYENNSYEGTPITKSYADSKRGFSLRLPDLPFDSGEVFYQNERGFTVFEFSNDPSQIVSSEQKRIFPDVQWTTILFKIKTENNIYDDGWTEQTFVDAFYIHAYPRDWWDAYITINENGVLSIDGQLEDVTGENFVGKNNQYAVTFSIENTLCPRSPLNAEDRDEQNCALEDQIRKTVLPTIQVYEPI